MKKALAFVLIVASVTLWASEGFAFFLYGTIPSTGSALLLVNATDNLLLVNGTDKLCLAASSSC